MDSPQNATPTSKPTTKNVTDWRHQALIDFRAVNGLIVNDDGMTKLTVDQLAHYLKVDRKQLYRWQDSIPDFWDKVEARKREIAPKSRIAKVEEVMFLSALKPGNDGYKDRVLYLSMFKKGFRLPTQPLEHEAGDSWAALLSSRRGDGEQIIEGEIVNADQNQS